MLSQLSLLLLLTVAMGVHDCTRADEIECLSSVCYDYYYTNSSCVINSSNTCTVGQVLFNGACVTCSSLPASNCSTVCRDYQFQAATSSGPQQCTKCGTTFSDGCVRCTTSACLICAYSSNLTLSTDGLSCINSNCIVANCLSCYFSGTRCYRCKTGFEVSGSAFSCAAAACNIPNCFSCATTSTCANCYPGYFLTLNQTVCEPICDDINCQDCIAPGICGTCLSAYAPDSTGFCVIDCAQIAVTGCAVCLNSAICVSCNSGLQLQSQGTACVPTCGVTNCEVCVSGDTTTCRKCLVGFDLSSNGTCSTAFCHIEFCQTCLNFTACSACISNFTLSSNKQICFRACYYSFDNCLLCSNTRCTTCYDGYYLNSTTGTCFLVCSAITNCIRCYSSVQCASCAAGFVLSADLRTCTAACKDVNCQTCPNPAVLTCTSCKTGYTLNPTTSRCQKNCQEGQVDVSTTTTITCQDCKMLINNCDNCNFISSTAICTRCQSGYFVNGQKCDLCSIAITDCLTCSSPTTCTSCFSGFKLIDGACSNAACNAAVTNCYACRATATGVCAICLPGFRLVSGVCTQITCSDGFVLDLERNACICPLGTFQQTSQCKACENQNCLNCTISACYHCKEGYYPLGSSCQPCISNCKNCTSGSNCVECNLDYSLAFDGTCISFAGGELAAAADAALYYGCHEGCLVCVTGTTSTERVVCLVPRFGYSLVGGEIIKCSPGCEGCDSFIPTLCTACYPKYTLISGSCVACNDANALTCSPINVNYSLTCIPGFTAVYFVSTGGLCRACSLFCSQCDSAGPGNCDEGQCNPGSVQLVGTTNCSLCFEGCIKCDAFNPNTCLDCGFRRYIDTNRECQRCATGCKKCRTSSTNCQACDRGYVLVSGTTCTLIPEHCFNINSTTGKCTGCFVGYALNADSTGCDISITCNSTSSCQNCPDGFFLLNQQCFQCNLTTNCKQCDPANSTACIACNFGYYVDASSACQPCSTNCEDCDSDVFCTQANEGFYIILNESNEYTGQVASCLSPCATCIDHAGFCLSCISGYSLYGSMCRRDLYLLVVLVLGQGTGSNPIFQDTDNANLQLFLTVDALNRLGAGIDAASPSKLKDGRDWRYRQLFNSISSGSVRTEQEIEAGSYTNADEAKNDLTNALNNGIDGARVISSSVTAQGFSNQEEEEGGTNLGLILGLAIPLGILFIMIIILLIYSCRKDKTDYGDENKNGFYSEEKLDKAEEI